MNKEHIRSLKRNDASINGVYDFEQGWMKWEVDLNDVDV
jgi:hypothetical protein